MIVLNVQTVVRRVLIINYHKINKNILCNHTDIYYNILRTWIHIKIKNKSDSFKIV